MYIFVSLFRLGFGVGSMRICENLGLGKRLGFIDDFRYPSASARNWALSYEVYIFIYFGTINLPGILSILKSEVCLSS